MEGAGIALSDGDIIMTNTTIVNNFAGERGGGIYISGPYPINSSFFASINSIFWNNIPEELNIGSYYGLDTVSITYSDIKGGQQGVINTMNGIVYWLSGNINAEPMFVDTSNGDFRLQAGSPCIDAGIQDTILIYNNGQDTLIVPPMAYNGSAPDMGAFEFGPPLGITEEVNNPLTYALGQNYPNPFNPTTTIEFSIPKAENITFKIYNLLGQEVATLVSGNLKPGKYKYNWNASGFASGMYLCKIEAGSPSTGSGQGFVQTRKLILLK